MPIVTPWRGRQPPSQYAIGSCAAFASRIASSAIIAATAAHVAVSVSARRSTGRSETSTVAARNATTTGRVAIAGTLR